MTHSLMQDSRNSSSHSTFFILLGIPGLENYQFWVAFPFCVMYIVAVTGNSYCEHMAVLKLVCTDTKINRGYGLFVAFSVVGFNIIVISVSYVMILRAVLRLPSGEARLKAFGTCASHIGVSFIYSSPFHLPHPPIWPPCAPCCAHHVC
ncbi:Olfactory receptor 52R1 [Lemmus lemmus]